MMNLKHFFMTWFLFSTILCGHTISANTIWPEKDWVKASPESQGMSSQQLDAVAS
jgi:hypothetical protein